MLPNFLTQAVNGSNGGLTPEKVRPWVVLIMSCVLIAAGLLVPDAAVLMLGSTMLGVEPIVQAKKEVRE